MDTSVQIALALDRVIYVEAGDDKAILAGFEEGLCRSSVPQQAGAVVAEVSRLTASSAWLLA
jgi:protein ImuA